MKTIKLSLFLVLLLNVRNFTLGAQVQLGSFSYSEFFYSPKESHYREKTLASGYNKSNLSSNLGMSISYKLNHKLSFLLGAQRVNRDFGCDCVDVIVSLSDIYYISKSNCVYKFKTTYKIVQVPLSANYTFHSNDKFSHAIGIGNTIVYSFKQKGFFYDSIDSLYGGKSSGKLLSYFSPEVHYDLSAHLFNHTYANLSLGIREELSNQWNHAFFAKVGMSYSFEKDRPKRRRRR